MQVGLKLPGVKSAASLLLWPSDSEFPRKHIACRQNCVGKAKLSLQVTSLCVNLVLSFTGIMM